MFVRAGRDSGNVAAIPLCVAAVCDRLFSIPPSLRCVIGWAAPLCAAQVCDRLSCSHCALLRCVIGWAAPLCTVPVCNRLSCSTVHCSGVWPAVLSGYPQVSGWQRRRSTRSWPSAATRRMRTALFHTSVSTTRYIHKTWPVGGRVGTGDVPEEVIKGIFW